LVVVEVEHGVEVDVEVDVGATLYFTELVVDVVHVVDSEVLE
jgi:hypothetical protein